MSYTTIKITKEIKDDLERYAKARSLSLAAAVERLLEEAELREELREIKELLREQNALLEMILKEIRKKNTVVLKEEKRELYISRESDEELPSFLKDNPWVQVLQRRA